MSKRITRAIQRRNRVEICSTVKDGRKTLAKAGERGVVKGIARIAKVAGVVLNSDNRLLFVPLEDLKKINS